MKITVAEEADINELVQVEIESKKQSIPQLVEDYEIEPSSRVYRWQTYFRGQSPKTSKPERIVYKAIDNENKIIGFLSGHLSTRFNLDAEIQSFYVLKQEQRKGVGTKLLKEFANWLVKQNAKSLCVGFNPVNEYRSFYLKHKGEYLNEHCIIWNDLSSLLKTMIDN